MAGRREYSQEEIATLLRMKKEGSSFIEIAKALGRGHQGVQFKFKALQDKKGKSVRKRIAPKFSSAKEVLSTPTPRPMVAFIGNHSEITTAIKELFS